MDEMQPAIGQRPPAGTIVTCRHQPSPHVLNADDRWCYDPVPVDEGAKEFGHSGFEEDLLEAEVALHADGAALGLRECRSCHVWIRRDLWEDHQC